MRKAFLCFSIGMAVAYAATTSIGFAQYVSNQYRSNQVTSVGYPQPALNSRSFASSVAPPTARNSAIRAAVDQISVELGRANSDTPHPRLPGEFEPQRAMVLSISDWQPHHAAILQQIVDKTAGHTNLLILCNDSDQLVMATGWLVDQKGPKDHVFFCEMNLDTIWVRDFSPLLAETKSGTASIDFFYEGTRPKDDAMPSVWAERTKGELVKVEWTLQGGNLLSNGCRLALTTDRIFEDNYIRFPTPWPGLDPEIERRRMVLEAFINACNLTELVVLEPLQNEATQHVDMFATFLAADQVVVARLDARRDPVNSAILERNAARLARVLVDGKPMNVHRIDIPAREGTSWSAYTNVIVANDLVLVPMYDSDPPMMVEAARQAYEKLLPNHAVKTVDMTSLKALQGELHCLSMNLPAFAPIPDLVVDFEKAAEYYAEMKR